MKSRSRVVVQDVAQNPSVFGQTKPRDSAAEEVRSVQSTPLISASNELVGMLSTHYRMPHAFSEHSLQQVDIMTSRVAHLIESWRQLQRATP